MWPQGRIKIGDSWEYVYESSYSDVRYKQIIRRKVQGFENHSGRDCIVLEQSSLWTKNDLPSEDIPDSTGKVYYDYNEGIMVYAEGSSSKNKNVSRLVRVEPPPQ